MSKTKKLSDILTWVNHGEKYVEGMNGNLIPHVQEAYKLIREAVKKEMVDLPELDALVKSMKRMQQSGTNPYNGYEQSVLIDHYRALKQALWVQRCDYLATLKVIEQVLSDKLNGMFLSDTPNRQLVGGMWSELNVVRGNITIIEAGQPFFFKQRMIKEAVDMLKVYKG